MKKKNILIAIFLVMLCTAFTALADYSTGDVVTVNVSVSNPNKACAFDVGVSYDSSAFEFVAAAGDNGVAAGKNGFSFAALSPFGGGSVGTFSLRVKDTAVAGKTYAISAYSKGAYDYDDNVVSINVSVSGGSVTIAAKGCDHSYAKKVDVEPTCETPGKETYTCTKCGDSYTKEIPAKGHSWDDGKVTKQATCKEEGVKTYTCKVCNATKTEKIEKSTTHTWGDGVITKEPTCLVDGEMTVICTVCGKTETTVVKAPGVHTPGENTRVDKEPTCTEPGVGSYQCAKCGEWIADGTIPPRKHDLKEVVTEPTCGKDGQKETTCSRCDYHEVTVIPATGKHTYVEKITKEPTCLDKGVKTFTCSVCNHSYDEEIKANGHTPGEDLKQLDPTCTKTGYKYYTCTVCGAEVKEGSIPATGEHIYKVTEEVAATCTKSGKRVSTCIYGCGETKTETLKALNHKMGEWKVTKEPTCTAKGQQTRVCENGCGKTETKDISALNHKIGEWKVTKEPTCTEKGQQTRVCEHGCGKTETKAVNALGHDWGQWEITKPLTEKEPGEKKRTCNRCGKVDIQAIPNKKDYSMTVCSEGIRFRDLDNPITDKWYMFTPIDLSVDGTQTFDLVAGNMHRIGRVSVLVKDGCVTVTYRVNNATTIHVTEEYMTLIPSLSALHELDLDKLPSYAYGEPISIADTLGGDTKVLLLLCNHALYREDAKGVEGFDGKGKGYKEYVEQLKQIMD